MAAAAKKRRRRPTCRLCQKPLERDKRARHRVWYVCTNLFCEKNKRHPVMIGEVAVVGRH